MSWVVLALIGAFGQALSWALKKKTLENKGVNNTLGLVSYSVAGTMLFLFWGMQSSFTWPDITLRFTIAALAVVSLNVLAAWAAFKAFDQRIELSKLMPFMALTSLLIVPIEYILRDVLPSIFQVAGMAIVVIGSIIFHANEKLGKESLRAIKYFSITLVCYSIASPVMAVMVDESASGLFSGAVAHLGIAIGFAILVYYSRAYESEAKKVLANTGEWHKVLFFMIITGAVIAIFENGPINLALETAKASEVFALKRTMPLFAIILGVLMFKEKLEKRHIVGTLLLVFGSMMVVWFR